MKLLSLILILLTSDSYAISNKDIWNSANDPYRLGLDYLTQKYRYTNSFEELPKSGNLENKPWSGDYWPTYKGGISYRWNQYGHDDERRFSYEPLSKSKVKRAKLGELKRLSPAEKYDLYLGNYSYPLLNHERQRTQVLRTDPNHDSFDFDYEIPTWEGLCHGWAPATLLYENPSPVIIENPDGVKIPFGASDIKALLTFNMHYNNSRTYFLGKRCNANFNELRELLEYGEISQEEYLEKLRSAECLDVNAGSFHIVLANQIALLKEGFIADVTRDFEVWNQPVFAYDAHITNQREPSDKQRGFGTHKVIEVYLELHYVVERDQHWDFRINRSDYATKHYQYELELNAKGNIIGGEWISEDRPDFLWKRELPKFAGYFQSLQKIYLHGIQASED
jgi:hypothetical protein